MEFYKLKNLIIDKGGETHFFDRDTLKFFGERESEMRVLKDIFVIKDVCGEMHECYCIAVKRRKNWSGSCKPYTYYHYFDKDTYHHIAR